MKNFDNKVDFGHFSKSEMYFWHALLWVPKKADPNLVPNDS